MVRYTVLCPQAGKELKREPSMSNSDAKNINTGEPAKTTALSVINIQSFQARFYLRGVCFNQKSAQLIAWFFPQEESADELFDAHESIFNTLQEVQYTEGVNAVTVKVTKGSLFVSYTGNNHKDNLEDLTGSMAFGLKMNPERFPKWAKYQNGILKFRLVNGREYQFQCVK